MPYHTTNRTHTACDIAPLWDPVAVLGLCDDGRCVGFAPSQHRKCRNPVAYHNVQSFDQVVDMISSKRPDADLLRSDLVRMAEYGLCVRNHKNQVESMVDKWSTLIRTEDRRQERHRRDRLAISVNQGTISTSTRSSLPSPVRSSSTSSSRSASSTAVRASSLTTYELLASILASSNGLEALIASHLASVNVNTHQPVVRSPSRVSTSDISSLDLSRSTTLSVSAPTIPPVATTEREPTLGTSPREPSIVARAPIIPPELASSRSRATQTSEPEIVSTSHTRCQRTHARRLPMDEVCVICYEGAHLSECDPSEIVWCRSTCGRSFHKSCFDDWRAQCIIDGRKLTCSNCRADWDEECECNGCSIRHVERVPVESSCAICMETMVVDEDRDEGDEELTWCVHGCGRSVHKDCFDVWKSACESSFPEPRDATCVNCRVVWKDDCTH